MSNDYENEHVSTQRKLAMLLQDFLVDHDFSEVHSITVQAPAEYVFRSIMEITPASIPLFHALFVIRNLPALLFGKAEQSFVGGRPILQQMLSTGFVSLAEETDRELVVGTVGQFWRITGGPLKLADAQEFLAFDRPDYVKAAMNFSVQEDQGCGSTTLRTETRVRIPHPGARRKFAGYWVMIRWGSGLIRRMWLRAIRRRAEKEWHQVAG